MIYRILCSSSPTGRGAGTPGQLMGAFMAGVDGFVLKAPGLNNPRVRFYFTEAGWKQIGRRVVANARREGRVVKVIRRKNPARSEVFYRDELQVALLPSRRQE